VVQHFADPAVLLDHAAKGAVNLSAKEIICRNG
jgi:hypothetical protein